MAATGAHWLASMHCVLHVCAACLCIAQGVMAGVRRRYAGQQDAAAGHPVSGAAASAVAAVAACAPLPLLSTAVALARVRRRGPLRAASRHAKAGLYQAGCRARLKSCWPASEASHERAVMAGRSRRWHGVDLLHGVTRSPAMQGRDRAVSGQALAVIDLVLPPAEGAAAPPQWASFSGDADRKAWLQTTLHELASSAQRWLCGQALAACRTAFASLMPPACPLAFTCRCPSRAAVWPARQAPTLHPECLPACSERCASSTAPLSQQG